MLYQVTGTVDCVYPMPVTPSMTISEVMKIVDDNNASFDLDITRYFVDGDQVSLPEEFQNIIFTNTFTIMSRDYSKTVLHSNTLEGFLEKLPTCTLIIKVRLSRHNIKTFRVMHINNRTA